MRNFRVTVNGVTYDVAVEEVAGDGSAPMASAPVSAPAPVAAKAPAPKASANAFKLLAPMAGTIADIKVKVGDTVEKDQLGIMLEAMKMENEIFIPVAGKVTSICVTKGASVNADDVLLTIE